MKLSLGLLVVSALLLSAPVANAAAVLIDRAPPPPVVGPAVPTTPGGGGGGGACIAACGPISTTTPGGSSGFDGDGTADVVIKKRGTDFRLECDLDAASAGDLILSNTGNRTLHAGSKIAFEVLPANTRGYMTLNVDLPANGKARASDLFRSAGADTACSAVVIEESNTTAAIAQ